jgi:hypothetical protein
MMGGCVITQSFLRSYRSVSGSPARQFTGDSSAGVDASDLCLWAVGISLTHPSSGELMTFSIEEPPLFDAVRAREFEAWRDA